MKVKKLLFVLAFFAAASFALALSACDDKELDHEHSYETWVTVTAAKCEEEGSEKSVCTVCGKETTRPIPALGHAWGEETVETPPSCTEGGLAKTPCTRCTQTKERTLEPLGHDWQTVTLIRDATCEEDGLRAAKCSRCTAENNAQVIPARGHDMQRVELIEEATCTDDGYYSTKCSRCEKTGTETVSALGHDWEWGEVVEEATCTAGGRAERHCKRAGCDVSEVADTEPLGHDYEKEFTIDREPTFEEAGSKSHHCTRCGDRDGEEAIDKLDENTPIDYNFRAVRPDGSLLAVTVTVQIFKQGVSQGTLNIKEGVKSIPLLPAEYTVTVLTSNDNFPEGYTAEPSSYTVRPGNPNLDIVLTPHLISAPMTEKTHYAVGSVMHDFELPTLSNGGFSGDPVRLSDLLERKQFVMLNFWYVGCVWCEREFPAMQTAYAEYKDRMEIVAVNSPFSATDPDTDKEISDYVARMGLTFPVVRDPDISIFYALFRNDKGELPQGTALSWPTTVIVDRDGVIVHIEKSAIVNGAGQGDPQLFRDLFEKYSSAPLSVAALPAEQKRKLG